MKKNKKSAMTKDATMGAMMISKLPKNIIPKNVFSSKNSALAKQAGIIVGAACAGAAIAYFLDPDSGKKRRGMVMSRVSGLGLGAVTLSSEQFSTVSGFVKETLSQGLSFFKETFLSDSASSDAQSEVDPIEQGSADGVYATPAEAPEMNVRGKKSFKNSYASKTDGAYPQ